jgi:integrase
MASKRESKKVKCLNEEEIKIFKNAVIDSYYRDCFLIQLDTGLRIGELLALTWKDINFEKKLINVNKTLVKQKDSSGKQIIVSQSFPKTNAGKRTVPMTDECFKVLSERNRKKSDSELLFPSKNNTFIDSNNIRRNLRCVCKKANLENFSTHTLRHTFSTKLFNKNIHPKTVAILMGHSKVEIALNNYTHVDDENKFNAIDKLN